MNFLLSPEQEQLRTMCREVFLAACPDAWPDPADGAAGYDGDLWHSLAADLDLVGLPIPADLGGTGAGIEEVGLVLEQIGYAGIALPYLPTVAVAANVLLASGDDVSKGRLLPEIAAGGLTVTLAVADRGAAWTPSAVGCRAEYSGDQWRLTGVKRRVPWAATAGLLLIAARAEGADGLSLFGVVPGSAGLTVSPLTTLDATRPLADLALEATPAQLIGSQGAAWPWIERAYLVGAACLAAELVGGAERALGMAVEYAKTRIQFDRAIGSFQAVKHKCASMLVAVEASRAAAYYALWAAEAQAPDLPIAARAALVYAADAFTRVASDNIQIHGGIGFTWEHPAGRLFKRARSARAWFGGPYALRDELAPLLEIEA